MAGTGSRTAIISIVTMLSFGVASCGPTKVAQCNQLITVANQAVEDVQTVTASAAPDDTAAMMKVADAAEQARNQMQTLEFEDEQLQIFQTRFVEMYSNTSQATRELVAAVDERNGQAARQAYNNLQTATDQESPLVDEVNTYCSAS